MFFFCFFYANGQLLYLRILYLYKRCAFNFTILKNCLQSCHQSSVECKCVRCVISYVHNIFCIVYIFLIWFVFFLLLLTVEYCVGLSWWLNAGPLFGKSLNSSSETRILWRWNISTWSFLELQQCMSPWFTDLTASEQHGTSCLEMVTK